MNISWGCENGDAAVYIVAMADLLVCVEQENRWNSVVWWQLDWGERLDDDFPLAHVSIFDWELRCSKYGREGGR